VKAESVRRPSGRRWTQLVRTGAQEKKAYKSKALNSRQYLSTRAEGRQRQNRPVGQPLLRNHYATELSQLVLRRWILLGCRVVNEHNGVAFLYHLSPSGYRPNIAIVVLAAIAAVPHLVSSARGVARPLERHGYDKRFSGYLAQSILIRLLVITPTRLKRSRLARAIPRGRALRRRGRGATPFCAREGYAKTRATRSCFWRCCVQSREPSALEQPRENQS